MPRNRPRHRAEGLPPGAGTRRHLGDVHPPASAHTDHLIPHTIAPVPTALIGRDQEVAETRGLLHRPEVRLLTFTGPPGVGKTRLGIEVAQGLVADFNQAVYFVDLAPITQSNLVAASIARAIGIREAGPSVIEHLKRVLLKRRLLLLLDNFEHLAPAAADVGHLIATCPQIKILATSRVPLRLRWEREFPLSPLEAPDLSTSSPQEVLDRSPAVALFVARARAVHPGFRLDRDNARDVSNICRRLDGLPLAIELAAVRTKVLSPRAIYDRLVASSGEHGIRLLTSPQIDVSARHRTLADAIAWSYQLLEPDQQTLLRRLSVFQGGCILEAAAAVCGGDDSGTDILDDLSALVDHSLVQRSVQSDGQFRFRMLQTIRDFALDQLHASGEADAMRARHADFFVSLAEDADPQLLAKDQIAWLDRLGVELDNIRAVFDWALREAGDPEVGRRLGTALYRFWDKRAYLTEGRQWLERILATSPQPSPGRVRVLIAVAYLCFMQGDLPHARPHLDEALEIARALNDTWGVAFGLVGLAAIVGAAGDAPRAVALLEESLSLSRETGLHHPASSAQIYLSLIAAAQGDYAKAEALGNEALQMSRELGEVHLVIHALLILAAVALLQGRSEAAALLRECLPLSRDLKDTFITAACLDGVAWLAAEQEKPEMCARLLGAAGGLREHIGATDDYFLPTSQVRQARSVNAVRYRLGAARFAAAKEAGQRLPVDMVFREALAFVERARLADRPAALLSSREQEVVVLIARGLTNREIADELHITEGTAANHIQHILNKLGLNSRVQIALWAVEQGLKE